MTAAAGESASPAGRVAASSTGGMTASAAGGIRYEVASHILVLVPRDGELIRLDRFFDAEGGFFLRFTFLLLLVLLIQSQCGPEYGYKKNPKK